MSRQGSLNGSTPAVYAVPAPVVDLAPEPAVHAVTAPGVEYIAPAPAIPDTPSPVVEYIAPALAVERLSPDFAPVVEYIAPAPAVVRLPSDVENIAPATPICHPTPVVEYIAPVPTSTPAVSSLPSPSVQSRQSAHRVSTEVPTVSSRHHDEWLRAERVLRARSARQGYLFRQMKRRDTQLAAQLTSLGKACEVARGSPCGVVAGSYGDAGAGVVFQVAGL